jgi:hypothetical protein
MWAKQNRRKQTSDSVRFAAVIEERLANCCTQHKKGREKNKSIRPPPSFLSPSLFEKEKKRDSFSSSLVVDEGLWLVHIKTKSRPYNSHPSLLVIAVVVVVDDEIYQAADREKRKTSKQTCGY